MRDLDRRRRMKGEPTSKLGKERRLRPPRLPWARVQMQGLPRWESLGGKTHNLARRGRLRRTG